MNRFAILLLVAVQAAACGSEDEPKTINTGSTSTANNGESMQRTALYRLSESWPSDSEAATKALLDQMTMHDHFVLEYVGEGPFKEAVFRRACAEDSSVTWTYDSDGTAHDCALAQQQWEECVDFVGEDGCLQNIDIGRNDVLIYYRCQTGEIDPDTCALYGSITQQIDQRTAETTDTIVRNTGDECQVGVDPGCYP